MHDGHQRGHGNKVFDRALRRTEEPRLARMIRRHQDDELRHERMLTDRRVALGLPEHRVPVRLKARVYGRQSRMAALHLLDSGLLRLPPLIELGLRSLVGLGSAFNLERRTAVAA